MYDFTKDEIKNVIDKTKSMTAASKLLGVKYDTFKKFAKKYNLFIPNPSGKGIMKSVKYKTADDVFKRGNRLPSTVLIKWVKLERDWYCENCGINKWMNNPLTLEIDHIDGDNGNNLRNNLKILCPNCHSQTPTWRGRNLLLKKQTKKKVSDNDLILALNSSNSIREALIKVKLAPKGGNYNRIYRLLNETNLNIIKEI